MSDGTPAGAVPAGGEGTPPASTWTTGLDEETRGFVELRQWKDPGALVKSYRDLEKLKGMPPERLAAIPDKADDADGWNALYAKLGRPDSPDKYEIVMPSEGGDEEFAKWARGAFHELGITGAQARALTEKWNEYAGQRMGADTESVKAEYAKEQEALKKEWGASYEQNLSAVKMAATQLGIPKEQLDALEGALGYGGLMRHLLTVGTKLGEDSFVNGDGGKASFGLTPAGAKAKLSELRADSGFADRLIKGDVKAKDEWERLHKIAFPEEA